MEAIGENGSFDRASTRDAADVAGQGYTFFRDGDIIRARVTPCFENGKGALLEDLVGGEGLGTTELFAFVPGPKVNPRYLFYVLMSSDFMQGGAATIYGAHGVKRVDENFARDYRVWLPPIRTQRAIADFLDAETARIDALIEKKQRMVEVLEARRRVLISRAVAGASEGSNLIERETRPLRAFAEVALGRQRAPQHEFGPFMTKYLRAANVKDGDLDLADVKEMNFSPEEKIRFSLRVGDVLVSEGSGSLASVGACAVWVGDIDGTICFQNTLLRLRPRADTNPAFLGWWARHAFVSGVFSRIAEGANIFHLSAERVRALRMAYVEPEEQQRVAHYLIEKTDMIDRAVDLIRSQVARLQEHRQALITAAVTGELEVPGMAA